jgi:NAD(P)-dependent dehydrogenase (short-subunit alcohol dehydrogenase family)
LERVPGKVAIVTGAGSSAGLGFATARALAREGASVVLSDIDETGARARAAELASLGYRAIAVLHDVTSEESWVKLMDHALKAFEKLDILVNNAGITISNSVVDMALAEWTKQIDVNLTGAFLGCKYAVATIRKQGAGGSIINVSSIAGLRGFPSSVAYGSSKGGIRQMSRVVAVEGAKDAIRCNSVFPGMIMTDMHKNIVRESPERHQSIVARIPMGRTGEPDDVAHCILYLASDEAKYVTGAEFVIDGGLTAAG